MSASKNILIGLTGSIACYKTCTVISRLVQAGHNVEVIATPAALKFVGVATLEGLTGRKVHSDLWEHGQHMAHIDLGRWADLFIIAPLTANHISKMALGLADDLLTSTYLAFEKNKKVIFAPAMNHEMYTHPTIQTHLETLKKFSGHQILNVGQGVLACGDSGLGKMAEPEAILAAITQNLATPTAKKILVTYGGTREPIDAVRAITNTSSGQTGHAISQSLVQAGHHVSVLCSVTAPTPDQYEKLQNFTSHADLQKQILNWVQEETFDAIIHLAAVSDYTVEEIIADEQIVVRKNVGSDIGPNAPKKLDSTGPIALKLRPTEKIITQIKSRSRNPHVMVIGFKLTSHQTAEEQIASVTKLLNSPGVDYVAHNEFTAISPDRKIHPFTVYGHNDRVVTAGNAQDLSYKLNEIILQGDTL